MKKLCACSFAFLIAIILVLPLQSCSKGSSIPQSGLLNDVHRWQASGTSVHFAQDSSAAGGFVPVHIDFPARSSRYPNAKYVLGGPSDWHGKSLVLTLTNLESVPVKVFVRIDDEAVLFNTSHSLTAETTIGRLSTVKFSFPVEASQSLAGVNGMGAGGGILVAGWSKSGLDASHVVGYQIFLEQPQRPVRLVLEEAKLFPDDSAIGVIDEFGQSVAARWAGKITSAQEMQQSELAEEKLLNASGDLETRDRFGGWKDGPEIANPKRTFITHKLGSSWWLIDPDGHLFFSIGMNTVVSSGDLTETSSRKALFAWLPQSGDALFKQHGGAKGNSFDFYGANLERKYGGGYRQKWKAVSLSRLRDWGFNTCGNWSDECVPNKQVPYVVSLTSKGTAAEVKLDGKNYPDPFDPHFSSDVKRNAEKWATLVAHDPMCVGYFVDNEPNWSIGRPADVEPDASKVSNTQDALHIAYAVLAQPTTVSPAKTELLRQLKNTYQSVDNLNSHWGTTYSAWEDFDDSSKTPTWSPNPVMQADLSAFVRSYAEQYFRCVRDALRQVDPAHLYLGCRFDSFNMDQVQIAAKYCDVVSFNIYKSTVDTRRWAFLSKLDKPCLVSEFHFGALDRGAYRPGLVQASDQAERGQMYAAYVDSVLSNPALVGCHWFEYVDEPATGRILDGENFNCGFVSITDTPYAELVAAAKRVHETIYAKRMALDATKNKDATKSK